MMNIKQTIEKHEKIVFMFSGGKDSVACLYLLREWLDKITVLWVNPGDMFPENERIVREVQAMVPNFLEVKSDVAAFKEKFGQPVDLVVINDTIVGELTEGDKSLKVVSGYDCCAHNYWHPGQQATKQLGATLIIRGQRAAERATAPIKSGAIVEGVEYLFPLEDWSQDDVINYLNECGFKVPEFFHFAESSLDCMGCTAFLHDFTDREEYMQKNHPVAHQENKNRIKNMVVNIEKQLALLKEFANG